MFQRMRAASGFYEHAKSTARPSTSKGLGADKEVFGSIRLDVPPHTQMQGRARTIMTNEDLLEESKLAKVNEEDVSRDHDANQELDQTMETDGERMFWITIDLINFISLGVQYILFYYWQSYEPLVLLPQYVGNAQYLPFAKYGEYVELGRYLGGANCALLLIKVRFVTSIVAFHLSNVKSPVYKLKRKPCLQIVRRH